MFSVDVSNSSDTITNTINISIDHGSMCNTNIDTNNDADITNTIADTISNNITDTIKEYPPLLWDGSFLGKINKDEFTKIDKEGFVIHCEYRNYSIAYSCAIDAYPCIVDEIAHIFGLTKCGTHSFYYGKSNKLKVMYNTGVSECLTGINMRIQTKDIKDKIQNIIIYRAIMGIQSNPLKYIIYRDNEYTFYNSKFSSDSLEILKEDKWRSEPDIPKCVRRMLRVNKGCDYDIPLMIIKNKIEAIFRRIDHSLHDLYCQDVYTRINDSLI